MNAGWHSAGHRLLRQFRGTLPEFLDGLHEVFAIGTSARLP